MGIHDDTLKSLFPGLSTGNARITSPKTNSYNCIAWAAHDTDYWWEPVSHYYWPSRALRKNSLAGWKSAFSSIRFKTCGTGDLENGYEKIAIYVDDNGKPTHVARQQINLMWTSKCGTLQDIEHDLDELEGQEYGKVLVFMKKKHGL